MIIGRIAEHEFARPHQRHAGFGKGHFAIGRIAQQPLRQVDVRCARDQATHAGLGDTVFEAEMLVTW